MGNTISLADWISDQIGEDKRFADNTEMAKAVGLSEGTIRNLQKGLEPELRTLQKLSNGLKYPLKDLQRMAGILQDDQEVQDVTLNFIVEGAKSLKDPKDRRTVESLIRSLLAEQDRETK